MKVAVLFVLIVISRFGFSQGEYSVGNLVQASADEFAVYKFKASKVNKAGAWLTLGGLASVGLGMYIFTGSWAGDFGNAATADLGLFMIMGGSVSTVVGIPVWGTGLIRVARIKNIEVLSNNAVSLWGNEGYEVRGNGGVMLSMQFRF